MNVKRHKVFISYHHENDQQYKDLLCKMKYFNHINFREENMFDDYSVRNGDIIDENMTDEQIRVKIRDEYIKDATVLILLVGTETKYRKFIDWEIHAAMYDTKKNPKMGILVINLPTIHECVRISNDSEKNLVSIYPNSWFTPQTREEYEKLYPNMPSRIIDNFVKEVPITVVDWNTIICKPENLLILIDNAFNRKDNITYDHSAPLRRNNS